MNPSTTMQRNFGLFSKELIMPALKGLAYNYVDQKQIILVTKCNTLPTNIT